MGSAEEQVTLFSRWSSAQLQTTRPVVHTPEAPTKLRRPTRVRKRPHSKHAECLSQSTLTPKTPPTWLQERVALVAFDRPQSTAFYTPCHRTNLCRVSTSQMDRSRGRSCSCRVQVSPAASTSGHAHTQTHMHTHFGSARADAKEDRQDQTTRKQIAAAVQAWFFFAIRPMIEATHLRVFWVGRICRHKWLIRLTFPRAHAHRPWCFRISSWRNNGNARHAESDVMYRRVHTHRP